MIHTTTLLSTRLREPPVAEKWKLSTAVSAVFVALITLVALLLRLKAISAKSVWLDEGFSAAVARLPWPEFFRSVWRSELNMAGYYLLLHIWIGMGKSEGFIRGLSVLISVATVPALYALGTRLFGRTTGLLAAGLLSINAFHVRYAQEARGYALVVFLATVATWLLVRNLLEPATAHWGIYAVVGAFMVYSHFYGALVILAHCISLFALRREQIARRKVVWSLALFVGLVVPAAIFVAKTATGHLAWLPSISVTEVLSFGVAFSGNYGRTLFVLVAFAAGMAALSAARIWTAHRPGFDFWKYWLVFLWLFVPLGIVLAASLAYPFFFPRYLSPCLPALVLLVAAGVTRLRPVTMAWGFGIAIALCSLLGTISYYHRDFDVAHEDWRTASRYILDHSQPGDRVYFYPSYAQVPFEFYRWQRQPNPVWPKSLNPSNEPVAAGENLVAIPGTELESVGKPGDRVWMVVLSVYNPTGKSNPEIFAVRDWLAAGHRRIDVQRFYPIDLVLFAKDAPLQNDSVSAHGQ